MSTGPKQRGAKTHRTLKACGVKHDLRWLEQNFAQCDACAYCLPKKKHEKVGTALLVWAGSRQRLSKTKPSFPQWRRRRGIKRLIMEDKVPGSNPAKRMSYIQKNNKSSSLTPVKCDVCLLLYSAIYHSDTEGFSPMYLLLDRADFCRGGI